MYVMWEVGTYKRGEITFANIDESLLVCKPQLLRSGDQKVCCWKVKKKIIRKWKKKKTDRETGIERENC